MKVKEIYICNGKRFDSYEKVELYAKSIGMRVTNTNMLRKNIYLITIGT